MRHTCNATFDVTGWEPEVYDMPDEGPALTRITIRKVFEGDLVGESTGEGLFCSGDDPQAGAGYLVSERVTGRLGGREGTFVIQHGGVMGPGITPHAFGKVVPGSGTGALTGLTGDVTLDRTEDGGHTLALAYDLPDAD